MIPLLSRYYDLYRDIRKIVLAHLQEHQYYIPSAGCYGIMINDAWGFRADEDDNVQVIDKHGYQYDLENNPYCNLADLCIIADELYTQSNK